VADFTPVARVGESSMLVVISSKMPQKTLAEVAVAAREHPADSTRLRQQHLRCGA
jgi:tripartite-type tricarboxylate transporter receptor subunit TctC